MTIHAGSSGIVGDGEVLGGGRVGLGDADTVGVGDALVLGRAEAVGLGAGLESMFCSTMIV